MGTVDLLHVFEITLETAVLFEKLFTDPPNFIENGIGHYRFLRIVSTVVARARSQNVNWVRHDIDFDLFKTLKQFLLEGRKELLVFRGVFRVHSDTAQLVLVTSSFVSPQAED